MYSEPVIKIKIIKYVLMCNNCPGYLISAIITRVKYYPASRTPHAVVVILLLVLLASAVDLPLLLEPMFYILGPVLPEGSVAKISNMPSKVVFSV